MSSVRALSIKRRKLIKSNLNNGNTAAAVGKRTLKQIFKDIKEEDERDDSENEDQPKVAPGLQSDDELEDHELAKMQSGILDAITTF